MSHETQNSDLGHMKHRTVISFEAHMPSTNLSLPWYFLRRSWAKISTKFKQNSKLKLMSTYSCVNRTISPRHIPRHQLKAPSSAVFPFSAQRCKQCRLSPVFAASNKLFKKLPALLVTGTTTSCEAKLIWNISSGSESEQQSHPTAKTPFDLIAFHLAAISGGHLSP